MPRRSAFSGEDTEVFPAAFRVRSVRLQWSADLVTSWAFEMETVILGWYAVLLGFGHVGEPARGAHHLLVAGFVQSVAIMSIAATLLAAAEGFPGRVMGVRTLAVYGLPLGLMASGFLIPWTMLASTSTRRTVRSPPPEPRTLS